MVEVLRDVIPPLKGARGACPAELRGFFIKEEERFFYFLLCRKK
jgi:hypothetical protein